MIISDYEKKKMHMFHFQVLMYVGGWVSPNYVRYFY